MNKYEEARSLQREGRCDEAERIYRSILARDGAHFDALYQLAIIHVDNARNGEAAKLLRRAVHQDPGSADAHGLLGVALMRLQRHGDALPCFERAIALRPQSAEAHFNLAVALSALGRRAEAISAFERALLLRPDWAEAHYRTGILLRDLGRNEAALEHLEAAIDLKPDFAEAHNDLGYVLGTLGRLDEARKAIEKSVELAPKQPGFYRVLADVKTFARDDPHLRAMEALAAGIDTLTAPEQMQLHFALGKAYADIGEGRRSFSHYLAGNALKRKLVVYDEEQALAVLDLTRSLFSREVMAAREGLGDPSPVPVFIVGMPRSGSTLVEQILASHPDVFGAGETGAFGDAAASLGGEAVASDMGRDELTLIGGRCVAALRALAPMAARITDKNLANFRHVGLIHLALPNAKIIHTRRDPLDTCVSCFSHMLMSVPFTAELGELGRYYRAYEALMAHWRAVLPPGVLLEVDYEAVVDDLEGQARRIVAHCGLDWSDDCLSFHTARRTVRTVSAIQVRQPIYRSAIGRARPYHEMLEPLLAVLRPEPA